MQYAVIINPASNQGNTRALIPKLEDIFHRQINPFRIFETHGTSHASEIVRIALGKGYTRIVAVGGDGLVNEVSTALVNTDAELAVIPSGTGNDFIRALGIENDFDKAIFTALTGRSVIIDTGICNDQIFVNHVGIGFDGLVAHEIMRRRHLGRGQVAYLPIVFDKIGKFKEPKIKINIDNGAHIIESSLFLLTVGNGITSGGGFRLTPDAQLNDGHFDVTFIGRVPKITRLTKLQKVMRGKLKTIKEVHQYQARHVHVELEEEAPAHYDGELLLSSVYDISIQPKSLKVVVGRHAHLAPQET